MRTPQQPHNPPRSSKQEVRGPQAPPLPGRCPPGHRVKVEESANRKQSGPPNRLRLRLRPRENQRAPDRAPPRHWQGGPGRAHCLDWPEKHHAFRKEAIFEHKIRTKNKK